MTMEGSKANRKSCDFCYLRKIKCDGQKPRCSHCVTYEMDCTYEAPSRKSGPKKRRGHAKIENSSANTQGRLRQLEVLVQQLTERLEFAERKKEVGVLVQHEETTAITPATPSRTTNSEDDKNSSKTMILPPLQHTLPIIQIYLRDFNSVLPLFHAETLLQLVHDCYSVAPSHRDAVVWAAINVVLALAQRYSLMDSHDIPSSVDYLSRAESVLSKVILGDIQLLNIQVLVGMVTLLQASQDLQPSLILIGTTMRLAHSIGLHDRTYSAHLDAQHAKQRACVFWLAYILDKDLSMRSRQPSIQIDDDINLDLPSPTVAEHQIEDRSDANEQDNGTGVITTTDGTVQMNYFATRIHLAVIEGGVYDYLYSTRSQKRNPQERFRALQSVACALEQWKASIPSEFSAAQSLMRVPSGMLCFLGILHSTSLGCTTLMNQAHAWDVEWVSSVGMYCRQGIEPLLPPKWEVLVDEARDLLVLFGSLGMTDRWNFWTIGCSYMTAMVLLTANRMHRLQHNELSTDGQLVEVGLQTLDRLAKETESEMLRSFQNTCTELHNQTERRCVEAAMKASSTKYSSYFLSK